jgi:hypothetical protein
MIAQIDVRYGSKAALTAPKSNFRFTPESGLNSDIAPCPKSATSRLMHRSNLTAYSMTSSARASSDGGTSRLSALAVLRLITSSYFIGCWTGISAATPPLSRRSA